MIWVINSFFVWLPLQAPQTEFDGESSMGGGVTAFVGATVFELGSVLLMLEAVNENRTQCFGWALEEAWEEVAAEAAAHAAGPPKKQHQRLLTLRPARDACSHPHPEKRALLGTAKRGGDDDDAAATTTTSASGSDDDRRPADPARSWEWWPTWSELRTHYFREVGFLACLSQFIGATIFWIAGFTGLPPIYDGLSTPAANGVYWLPQVRTPRGRSLVEERPRDTCCRCSTGSVPLVAIANMLTNPTTNLGRRRHWFHYLELAVHARNAAAVVHSRAQGPRVAHGLLEPGGSPGIHDLRRPGFCQRQRRRRVRLYAGHVYRVVGFPGECFVDLSSCGAPAAQTHHIVRCPSSIMLASPRESVSLRGFLADAFSRQDRKRDSVV